MMNVSKVMEILSKYPDDFPVYIVSKSTDSTLEPVSGVGLHLEGNINYDTGEPFNERGVVFIESYVNAQTFYEKNFSDKGALSDGRESF